MRTRRRQREPPPGGDLDKRVAWLEGQARERPPWYLNTAGWGVAIALAALLVSIAFEWRFWESTPGVELAFGGGTVVRARPDCPAELHTEVVVRNNTEHGAGVVKGQAVLGGLVVTRAFDKRLQIPPGQGETVSVDRTFPASELPAHLREAGVRPLVLSVFMDDGEVREFESTVLVFEGSPAPTQSGEKPQPPLSGEAPTRPLSGQQPTSTQKPRRPPPCPEV